MATKTTKTSKPRKNARKRAQKPAAVRRLERRLEVLAERADQFAALGCHAEAAVLNDVVAYLRGEETEGDGAA